MKLTDENVIKILKRARLPELEYRIGIIEDAEGMSDLDILLEEVDYFLYDLYECDGNVYYDELWSARKLLRETKYGKVIPIDISTFKPKDGYSRRDIQNAKDIVNEYNRLKSLREKISKIRWGEK